MRFQRLRNVLRWTLRAILALAVLLVAFILEENIRGHIMLARYKAELRAKGEKLTLAELNLPEPSSETNGAATLLAIADQLEQATRDSRRMMDMAGGLLYLKPGVAVVVYKQQMMLRRVSPSESLQPIASWEEVSKALQPIDASLEETTRVLQQTTVEFKLDYAAGSDMHLPHLNHVRTLSRWCAFSVLLKLHDGDVNGALDRLEAMRKLADSLADERTQISQLVRISIGTSILYSAWEVLQSDNLTDLELERLQRICGMPDVTGDVLNSFEREVVSYQRIFRTVREFDWVASLRESLQPSHLVEGGWKEAFRLPVGLLWKTAWLDQDERRALELWYTALRRAREGVGHGSWAKARGCLPEDVFPRSTPWFYDRWRYMISPIAFNGGWRNTVLNCFRIQCQRDLALTAIALKRYEPRYSKFPSNLESLVTEFLPQQTRDCMDGNPPRYHVNGNGTFTLYSVGEDCVDNGGDPSPLPPSRALDMRSGRDEVWPTPATHEEVEAWPMVERMEESEQPPLSRGPTQHSIPRNRH